MSASQKSPAWTWLQGLCLLFVIVLTLSIEGATPGAWAAASPPTRPLSQPGNPVVYPAGNTHTAPLTAAVSITYDEPISPTTVSTRTFAVFAMQTGMLTQTYSVVGGAIDLTPTLPFKPGELVQASATTGTRSLLDGTAPVSPTVWQFRAAVTNGDSLFLDSGQSLGISYSRAVALGDLDGDGDLDAWVGNGDGTNHVWLNDGAGMFDDSGQNLGSSNSQAVALGDLDRDGDLDALVGNGDGANRIWLNDGSGIFTSSQSMGDAATFAVALGDLDGDGDLDALVGNDRANDKVWLNDGAGTFYSGQELSGTESAALALGDLDGDGDLDAFLCNWLQGLSGANQVWWNDGTGTFTDSGQALGAGAFVVALGDLDDDGDLDAFFIDEMYTEQIWLNDSTGIFSDSGQVLDGGGGGGISLAVALGDLEGDGDLDIFLGKSDADQVWLNDGGAQGGTPGFFSPNWQSLGSTLSKGVALGDLDGDGDLDAFAATSYASSGPPANKVWLNQMWAELGLTNTAATALAPSGGAIVTYTLWFFNNGDGVATDVVVTAVMPSELTNLGFTSIGPPITPIGSISYTWQVADLGPWMWGSIIVTGLLPDYDVTLDSTASITTSVLDVEPGNNQASMSTSLPMRATTAGPEANGIAVPPTASINTTFDRDVDASTVATTTFTVRGSQTGLVRGIYSLPAGDAVQFDPAIRFKPGEVIVTTASSRVKSLGGVSLAPYAWQFTAAVDEGSGLFMDSGQALQSASQRAVMLRELDRRSLEALNSSPSVAVSLGDLDGDGDLDAFVGNLWASNEVWLNTGTSVFTDSGQTLGDSGSLAVALGDMDGDGDLDGLVGNWNANKVWLNDGAGAFTVGQSLGNSHTYAVALGDLDGDGDLDAFVGNWDGANRVWLNDGLGAFTDSEQSLGGADSSSVALGDVDGDGDLDAFVGNWDGNQVWLNDGTGVFFDSGQNLGNSRSYAVALGDLNADGALDAFVGNGDPNRVWLNDGRGLFTSTQSLGGSVSFGAALGDLNGDGALDAFAGNGDANRVWLNDGVGVFDSGERLGSTKSAAVALGDVDGDGDLDVFVSNDTQPNQVWLNRDYADLAITKTVTPDAAASGDIVTYTLTYHNDSARTATGVVITDIMPASLTPLTFTYSAPDVSPTTGISYVWQVGDLGPYQDGVITVTGVVKYGLSANLTVTNSAIIAATTVDTDTTNNSSWASATITVGIKEIFVYLPLVMAATAKVQLASGEITGVEIESLLFEQAVGINQLNPIFVEATGADRKTHPFEN